MIFIERYPLKRCQCCVKLIASKVNCFLNINDLSEVQLCMSSNSWTWECPHTKDGADHVPLIFLSSVFTILVSSVLMNMAWMQIIGNDCGSWCVYEMETHCFSPPRNQMDTDLACLIIVLLATLALLLLKVVPHRANKDFCNDIGHYDYTDYYNVCILKCLLVLQNKCYWPYVSNLASSFLNKQ